MALNFLVHNNVIASYPGPAVQVVSNPQYVSRMGVSIDASNQLHLTFSMHKNGVVMTANLGTCSFVVYDRFGAVVAGLSGSGIAADANGLFIASPISAASIQDLTHYSFKVTIIADNLSRTSILTLNIGE